MHIGCWLAATLIYSQVAPLTPDFRLHSIQIITSLYLKPNEACPPNSFPSLELYSRANLAHFAGRHLIRRVGWLLGALGDDLLITHVCILGKVGAKELG